MRELRPSLAVETPEAPWVEAFGVLVEGVDEDPERQIPLELRRGACEDELTAPVDALRELGEQAGLADAGLADELDRAREALLEIGEQLVERVELRGTPDELLGRVDDRPSFARSMSIFRARCRSKAIEPGRGAGDRDE